MVVKELITKLNKRFLYTRKNQFFKYFFLFDGGGIFNIGNWNVV